MSKGQKRMIKWLLLPVHLFCIVVLIVQEIKLCFPNWFILVVLVYIGIAPFVIALIKGNEVENDD